MDREFHNLLNAAIDGQLEKHELERLQDLIATGKKDEEFLRAMSLHLGLSEKAAPIRAFSAAELRAVTEAEARFAEHGADLPGPGASDQLVRDDSPVKSHLGSKGGSRWLSFAAGIAVSLLFVLPFVYQFLGNRAAKVALPTPVEAHNASAEQPGVAARIVKKIDCVWDNDRWMVKPPVDFRAGEQISLTSGLLVLEFESGAQVTLQGPASASPISDNALSLFAGGLTATVPEEARGFAVHTSSGEIIDLGTEFGVFASEDGAVEAHVFKGKVVSRLGSGIKGRADGEVSITAGEAQKVSSNGAMRTIPAQENRFLRLGFGMDKTLPEPPPIDHDLVLWLSADGRIQLDDKQRVMAWGDNPSPENGKYEDVWQVHPRRRPQWNSEAINGHPAIRFGEQAVLVSEPVELSGNQTNVVVFRLDPYQVAQAFDNIKNFPRQGESPRPDLGVQLLNLYGPPHPVIQIDADLTLSARVHLGRDPQTLDDVNIGVECLGPLNDDLAHIVVYTIDSDQGISRLYLDGQVVSETTNVPAYASTYTPRYIGNHPYRAYHGFPGYIGEVMLHDSALDKGEVENLSVWLGEKYSIPVSVDQPSGE